MMKAYLLLLSLISTVITISACTSQSASESAAEPGQLSDLSAAESAALANLSMMINEQFSIYDTQVKFSATGGEFREGLPPSDDNYSYQIAQVTPTKVYMTAIANQSNLRSLSAQIFVIPEASRAQAYSNSPISGSICVTNTPSQSAPTEPADATVAEPPCPSGSFSAGVFYPYGGNQ